MSEPQNIEYKPSWHNDYLKWTCSFANALGGRIYISLHEDEPSKKQKKISNIISKLAHTDKKIMNTSQSVKYPVWKLADE